jgi:hypothetical protein
MDKSLEERVKIIEERNKRVELDKKWETSPTRILSVGIITYIIAVIALYMIKAPNPFLNALIPTLGFILSTQSLPFIKKFWMKNK